MLLTWSDNAKSVIWVLVGMGFLGSPYERDCYLVVVLDSQTTNLPSLKTNMSPENQWLEDAFPTEIVHF